ncbi:signal peptidase II [Streptosporangium sp. KLBMP 9127]|nr:signal peptidase II [Streptosporangium sp. KLBMP 9127]
MRGLQAAGGTPLNEREDDGGAGRPPLGPPEDTASTGGNPAETPADSAAGPADSDSAPVAEAPRARRLGILAAIAAVIYILDLITKVLVVEYLEGREPVQLIADVLQLRVIRNSGAAFSIGAGLTLLLTLIATGVVIAILRTARNLRSLPWAITLGLLLGGAFGNLTDRILRSPSPLQGHVVDFVQVFPATGFPIFNVADSSIVCGGILAVFLAWRGYQLDGTRQHGADS